MAVLLKCGALFFHIPKTGGNWVTETLEEEGLVMAHVSGKHASDQLAEFEGFFRQSYAYSKPNRALYRFCFVRHPLRWLESWWRMQQAQGWPARGDSAGPGGLLPFWNPTVELDGLGSPDFSTFVRNVVRQRPGFVSAMYSRYVARGMHFVGRQESLVDDTICVLRVLGVAFDEKRVRRRAPVNVGQALPLTWAPGLEQVVLALEQAAISSWYGTNTERTPSIQLAPPYERSSDGRAWRALLPGLTPFADAHNDLCRSLLAVREDGRLLRKAHASEHEIRTIGLGAYCHWLDSLLFSTSDNTDPNTNGRRYSAAFELPTTDYVRIQMP